MIDEQWKVARNVLLIRLDNLGDVLLMTPAFHAVKVSLPEARLTLLTSPVGAQVGRLDPDIDEVIAYQAPWVDPWHLLPHDSEREQQMIERLRALHFDGAIIFTSYHQSSLPAAYLCYLADIPLRAAASIDGAGSLLTTRHKHPERMMHEVERGLDLVGALGMQTEEYYLSEDLSDRVGQTTRLPSESGVGDRNKKNDDLVLRVPDEASVALRARLNQQYGERPLLVVHPGCSMVARTYPWQMYVRVIDLLVVQLDAFVVVTGVEDEGALVSRVVKGVQPATRACVLPLAGVLPFPQFCALLRQADVVITNNTGPMHVAAAVKTPVVALFALTNPPEQWHPWQVAQRVLNHDVPCRICYSRVCPYQHECLTLVSPQMVVDAAKDLLTVEGRYYLPEHLSEASCESSVGARNKGMIDPSGHDAPDLDTRLVDERSRS